MTDKPTASLTLRRSSWEHVFHVLHTVGLGELTPTQARAYRLKHKEHFSISNFWACIQALEQQFEQSDG